MDDGRETTRLVVDEVKSVTFILDSPLLVADLLDFIARLLRRGDRVTVTATASRDGQEPAQPKEEP